MKHYIACKGLALDLNYDPFLSGDFYIYMKRSRVKIHVECFFGAAVSENDESSSQFLLCKKWAPISSFYALLHRPNLTRRTNKAIRSLMKASPALSYSNILIYI